MKSTLFASLLIVALLAAACAPAAPVTTPETAAANPTTPPTATLDPLSALTGLDFDAFVDQSYRLLLDRDPEALVWLGIVDPAEMDGVCLSNVSDTFLHGTLDLQQQILDRLEQQYERATLSVEQQIIFDSYQWYLQDQLRAGEYMYDNYPVHQMIVSMDQGLQSFFTELFPITTKAQAQAYVACLSQVPTKMSQIIEALQLRQDQGVVLPLPFNQMTLPGIEQIANSSALRTPYYETFAGKIAEISALTVGEQTELLDAAEAAINESVLPAYQDLADFLKAQQEIAGTEIGVSSLPDGEAFYAERLAHHTTTDLTAQEIFDLGQAEMTSIQADMRAIFTELGYSENLSIAQAYRQAAQAGGVLNDADIKQKYEDLIDGAYAIFAPAFNIVPQTRVIVVDDPIGGYYTPPTVDGSRSGAFHAATSGSEYYYAMPSLAYHEAVPGHHFQLALTMEADIPLFQKVMEANGFVEGWALYAEYLMRDLGAYENDPYGELGYLQMMARRAARLVVDTGIHSQHWTFDQAVEYMLENTGMGRGGVEYEVARMAVWPGQATAYYVGFYKMRELRQEMETALGDDFDLKTFHDLILGSGTVPLTVMEARVDAYLAGQ